MGAEPTLVIAGGTVIDGTGSQPRRADVAIADRTIVDVATLGRDQLRRARIVDASGLIVCPGFVDIHTHSDLTLLSNPAAHSSVKQGVTTAVVGNCGLGVAPIPNGADAALIRTAVGYLDLDPAVRWDWDDVTGQLAALDSARPSQNVAALVGHLPLHAGVVGFDDTPATPDQIRRMQALLARAFDDGAFGLSTGLMYAPLTFATDNELQALGRTVADHDGLFAWHLRDYADQLLPSVEQALKVGAATGCRIQLSHLVAVGRRNWGQAGAAMDLVDAARAEGVDVAVDIYPYLAGSAPLSQRLPDWAQAGGERAIRTRLADPDVTERVRRHWADDALDWADVTISQAPDDRLPGRSMVTLAEREQRPTDDVALDLLRAYGNAVTMIVGGRSCTDLRAVITHPAAVIASDGQALDPTGPTGSGSAHPRSYGCFPRVFSDWVRTGELPVEDAVRKCTSAAAGRIGMPGRGMIAVGRPADLVVLDPAEVADVATFDEPAQHPRGIEYVLVNGRITVEHGTHTGERSGQILVDRVLVDRVLVDRVLVDRVLVDRVLVDRSTEERPTEDRSTSGGTR